MKQFKLKLPFSIFAVLAIVFASIPTAVGEGTAAVGGSLPSFFVDSTDGQGSGEALSGSPVSTAARLISPFKRIRTSAISPGLMSMPKPGQQIVFNFFDKLALPVTFLGVEGTEDQNWTARGIVEGHEGSLIIVRREGEVLSGTANVPGGGRFLFHGKGTGKLQIEELGGIVPRCETCEKQTSFSRQQTAGQSRNSFGRSGIAPVLDPLTNVVHIVDLMIVHTSAAKAGAGGDQEIRALAALAVAEANAVYQNSRANVRLRLVSQVEVAYAESHSFSTNLLRLRLSNDGFLDEVHTMRETNKADLVCLITEDGDTGFGGLASLMQEARPESKPFGFSVVRRKDAVGSFVFVHEVCHNFGCQHDRENAAGADGVLVPGVFPYSFGQRFEADGKTFRTVMAYPPGEVIPFLSTPNILFRGVPIGVDSSVTNTAADNVRTINQTAPIVSAYFGPAAQTTVPVVEWTTPAEGAVSAAGQPVTVRVKAFDQDGSIRQVEIYDGGRLAGVMTEPASRDVVFTLADLEPGPHSFSVRAIDNLGADSGLVARTLTVRPFNDLFSSRATVPGATFTLRGSTAGATREPNEPIHADNQGAGSVWYTWTAEKSGTINLVGTGDKVAGIVSVYQGASLSTLVPVYRSVKFDSAKRTCTLQADVVAGQTLFIAVDSLPGYGEGFQLALSYLPAPANDDFNGRLMISGEVLQITGTNNFATTEPGEPRHAGFQGGKSVWYEWTAPRNGAVLLTCTGGNVAWLVDAYIGGSPGSLTAPVGKFTSYDETKALSSLGFTAVATQKYMIAVDGSGGKSGAFTLQLAYLGAPSNDGFANRRILEGTSVSFSDNNSAATSEAGEPNHAGTSSAKSLWYSWTAPVSGPVKILMAGTGFSVIPDAYQGTNLSGLKAVNRGIKVVPGTPSELTFNAVLGETYQLVADGFGGRGGSFTFNLATSNEPARLVSRSAELSQSIGEFRFQISGSLGQSYLIEVSSDLTQWSRLKTGVIGSDSEIYQEQLPAVFGARFFRVTPLP